MEQYFAGLSDDEFPVLRSMATNLNVVRADDEFELGLAALFDRLQSEISAAPGISDTIEVVTG